MSASSEQSAPARPVPSAGTASTELTIVGGQRLRVKGEAEELERLIVDAARGSMMALAWFIDADTGERLGVNPEHVVLLRKLAP